ncbi:solute carrier, TRAMD3 or PAT1-domain-containing protein [Zopfochytrium polystomum]|nr:solute carrier, TRAMD3 or PAT1-domain-containing protein [Zopfochytrium polystomum]
MDVATQHHLTRPHDYLYDANFTVSSHKDHQKAMVKAQTHDVIINPVYDNMFSALRHYPPSHYLLRPQRLPTYLGHDRRVRQSNPDVQGSNRFKYFRRPIIPYTPSLGGQIVYAKKVPMVVNAYVDRPASPATRTVGMQTVYRESEAQTDPYSPEYILRPGSAPPELLALATLTYGMGLPAGMAELEMIERARAKRAWEAQLPKVVDEETFQKRLKMMEEMELKEWQEREDEIKRLQEARLVILTKVISQREQENEAINNERVERIWQRKLQEREAMMEKIERKRQKALRKLAEMRGKVEQKVERRDIIAEYANYSSKVYAPKARDGIIRDKPSNSLQLSIADLETYDGLLELESTFSTSVLKASISPPDNSYKKRNPEYRRELHMQEQLKLMDQKLKERKQTQVAEEKPLRFAVKIERVAQRPPTPRVRGPREDDEELEVAAILLQKLIRGRIAQNLMYQGKERRLQLINELRTRHTLKRATEQQIEAKMAKTGPESTLDDGAAFNTSDLDGGRSSRPGSGKREKEGYPDDEVSGTYEMRPGEEYHPAKVDYASPAWLAHMFEANIQSEYVGRTLDFLSKELVRLREERRIAAMVRLAERTRKLREAEETDRRKDELERRNKEDEVFKAIMKVHQETVDSYLEDVVAGSVEQTASAQAREQVRRQVEVVNQLVEEMERRKDNDLESCVADLVSSFLIPEVEKEELRNQSEDILNRWSCPLQDFPP